MQGAFNGAHVYFGSPDPQACQPQQQAALAHGHHNAMMHHDKLLMSHGQFSAPNPAARLLRFPPQHSHDSYSWWMYCRNKPHTPPSKTIACSHRNKHQKNKHHSAFFCGVHNTTIARCILVYLLPSPLQVRRKQSTCMKMRKLRCANRASYPTKKLRNTKKPTSFLAERSSYLTTKCTSIFNFSWSTFNFNAKRRNTSKKYGHYLEFYSAVLYLLIMDLDPYSQATSYNSCAFSDII